MNEQKQMYTVCYSNGIINGHFKDFLTTDYNKALEFANSWNCSAVACFGYNFYVEEIRQ